uniref:Uncharacterized protein n=1 Tax=Anguilla anguilla TaxID=7936 RepID=A0A0E9ULK0_ANGAN
MFSTFFAYPLHAMKSVIHKHHPVLRIFSGDALSGQYMTLTGTTLVLV